MRTTSGMALGLCFGIVASCIKKQPVTIREVDLRGSEKKTWVLHKENGRLLPRPLWGFAFYKKGHFFQYFVVRTTNDKSSFQARSSPTPNNDLPKCFATWHIIGDTLFTSSAYEGQDPYLLIRKLTDKELVYQEFIGDNHLRSTVLTAIVVPDTVSNMTLNEVVG